MQTETEIGTSRISRDAGGERSTYDDIVVGQDLGTLEWVLDAQTIAKQRAMDDDEDAMFLDGGDAFDGQVAPPQINYRPPRWLFSRVYNVRGVLYKWSFETFAPIRPDVPIQVSGRVVDKWIKNDREFVEYEATGTDPSGQRLFVTRRVHALDFITRASPRDGIGLDSGKKAEKI